MTDELMACLWMRSRLERAPQPAILDSKPAIRSENQLGLLVSMNQSQNSLPENPHQGDHEAGDGQKGNVGFSVPVIPGDQSPPVV
jgi:hypothetical protein